MKILKFALVLIPLFYSVNAFSHEEERGERGGHYNSQHQMQNRSSFQHHGNSENFNKNSEANINRNGEMNNRNLEERGGQGVNANSSQGNNPVIVIPQNQDSDGLYNSYPTGGNSPNF